jgi:hypothetical protein
MTQRPDPGLVAALALAIAALAVIVGGLAVLLSGYTAGQYAHDLALLVLGLAALAFARDRAHELVGTTYQRTT